MLSIGGEEIDDVFLTIDNELFLKYNVKKGDVMFGAIIGDIVGSRFEFVRNDDRGKNFEFWGKGCRPTDDSFMTLAVAKALYLCRSRYDLLRENTVTCMREVARLHKNTGWGGRFYRWLFEGADRVGCNSYGNGAGMRISPVSWVADSEEEVKRLVRIVTGVSHDHPESYCGAEAVAMAGYLARIGTKREEIRRRLVEYYPVLADGQFTVRGLQKSYGYDNAGEWVTCRGSVPQALVCFLESDGFEDAVRNAVSIGGDSDTIGAMAGGIAEAFYGLPEGFEEKALSYLTDDLQQIERAFSKIKRPRTPQG